MGTETPFSSLTGYAAQPVINLTVVLLIIMGGIGFLTWEDTRTNRLHFHKYRMQSKAILWTTAIPLAVPAVYFYFYEFTRNEFDLDTALRRKPQLILVDELAHTNAGGSRHAKRYQDVKELFSATLIGYVFYAFGFTESNIIAVYIFGVLVASIVTTSRLCGLLTSVVSVLVFNFFFTVPRFTFHFNDPDYPVTFTTMFVAAFLTGSLAGRLKENARPAYKLLKKDLLIYPSDGKNLGNPEVYRTGDGGQTDLTAGNEKEVAEWVLRNNKRAGATTDTLASANCLYLAIRLRSRVYGVVGICMEGIPLDFFENSLMLSVLGECALALENMRNASEKEEAAGGLCRRLRLSE